MRDYLFIYLFWAFRGGDFEILVVLVVQVDLVWTIYLVLLLLANGHIWVFCGD
jgi:hypothetical protein